MKPRYVNVDRETPMLLPPDLREWVREDDLVHFIVLAVESADLSEVRVRQHGGGSLGYPPGMMVALLIYAYANGIFSSRQIERASHSHVSVRYLCANLHPDHDTICTFRRENHALLRRVFGEVLKLADKMGLLQVGTVCLDGTKVMANAAKRRSLSWKELREREARQQQRIEELLQTAEAADTRPESCAESLPGELASRRKLKEKFQQAQALLAEQSRERAKERERDRQQWQANPIGDAPRKVEPQPKATDRINLTDPQSSFMPMYTGGYAAGYNAQMAVTAAGPALIVATEVCAQTNDRQQLLGMATVIQQAVPAVQQIVVDAGYDHARQIQEAERLLKVKVYCPPQEAPTPSAQPCVKPPSASLKRSRQLREQMRERIKSPEGKRLMRRRKTTVEPAFGMIKQTLGFRRFSLRGLEKVRTEWTLIALAFNCRRIARQWTRH